MQQAVIMEDDEMEMTKEEFQIWIKEMVDTSETDSPELLRRCNLLQSLLKRREKQAAHLLKLCESVAECESLVKKLYSLLGWEYRDTDSEEERNNGNISQLPRESVSSETRARRSLNVNGCIPQLSQCQDKTCQTKTEWEDTATSACLRRYAVVVLTRLPESKIPALHPSLSQQTCSKDDFVINCDSDSPWEPSESSSDSGSAGSQPWPTKKRRTDCTTGKLKKRNATKTNEAKKTKKIKNNTIGQNAVCILSTFKVSNKAAKVTPEISDQKITVDMKVVAKWRCMHWERGRIVASVRKEDGRLKYKVVFEEKKRMLVSVHHIACDALPDPQQLHVGTRVVVKCKVNDSRYRPGVLAEVATRSNCKRYLVFLDNHTPVYVELHSLHLVCRPLEDVLDDIANDAHRNFMRDYLKAWPYLPMTKYSAGQVINAECDGVQKPCRVEVVDCSLVQVAFQDDKHKEWIHRGSMRLEDMVNLKERVDAKQNEKQRKQTTS